VKFEKIEKNKKIGILWDDWKIRKIFENLENIGKN